MIIDTIDNASLYYGLGDGIAAALKYIESSDFSALRPGRYDIDGDQVYALVQDYFTRPRDAALWEVHRKYIDVQFVVSGREMMGYTGIRSVDASAIPEYNDEKDIVKFEANGDFILAGPGTFAIFTPQDAHMPAINVSQAEMVRKVVVKVQATND